MGGRNIPVEKPKANGREEAMVQIRAWPTLRNLILVASLATGNMVVAQQIKSADEFARNLQRNFEKNGYDVSVRANHWHELILTSDSFEDAATREAAASGLTKDPKTLCNLAFGT